MATDLETDFSSFASMGTYLLHLPYHSFVENRIIRIEKHRLSVVNYIFGGRKTAMKSLASMLPS